MMSADARRRALNIGLVDVLVDGLGFCCPRHSQDHSRSGEQAIGFLVWMWRSSGELQVNAIIPLPRRLVGVLPKEDHVV
jgi:hypothetical protein